MSMTTAEIINGYISWLQRTIESDPEITRNKKTREEWDRILRVHIRLLFLWQEIPDEENELELTRAQIFALAHIGQYLNARDGDEKTDEMSGAVEADSLHRVKLDGEIFELSAWFNSVVGTRITARQDGKETLVYDTEKRDYESELHRLDKEGKSNDEKKK